MPSSGRMNARKAAGHLPHFGRIFTGGGTAYSFCGAKLEHPTMAAVMNRTVSLRIATYNIHKCRGMDRRVSPERIAEVIGETEVDIVALQEVVRAERQDQLEILGKLTGFSHLAFGENRKHRGHGYGNGILSKFPIEDSRNYDVTMPRREPRGLLRADIRLSNRKLLHVLNVHLGTGLLERRGQASLLMHEELLLSKDFAAPRILLGDFNEWTRGLATKRLSEHFRSAEAKPVRVSGGRTKRMRSYPGFLPVLHLDHIYYDDALRLKIFRLHRTRTAQLASDHLPLVACFELGQ
jgi:endonuclease/exonuclease/phosphatase family metal-dependent hydrolase